MCMSGTCNYTALMDERPFCRTASHRLTLIICLDHCTPASFCSNFISCRENLEIEIAYMTTFVCSVISHVKKSSTPDLLLLAVVRVGIKNKNSLMKG